MIETILRVLPETKCVAIVLGSSPIEQFWREELGREFRRFENRLTFAEFAGSVALRFTISANDKLSNHVKGTRLIRHLA